MFNNYYVSYLMWYVIMVGCMLSFYGQNHNEPWERIVSLVLTLVVMLAVPRKQVKEVDDE